MNQVESIIAFVKSSSLPEDVKEVLTDRLMAEGLTTEVVDVLKEAFQDEVERLVDKAGVKLDPNDPEVVERYQKYEDGLAEVQKASEAEMAGLEKDISKQVVNLQASADKSHADQIRKDFP